ncbi:putative metal-binding motif-containing protein [Flagellimonas sp. 389]|uniref:putative metal-binding motif-containing protein n=1 Tax=Flagellimonas sp. 389 TaxID=2835862 RepID=UPI001BD67F68|nr:putative metal-binding motif-containing protein [Flagellimonas sp. 389]MBS9463903.1 putative metal-binding motif-containing protein [Flagellimonas sp. 389]
MNSTKNVKPISSFLVFLISTLLLFTYSSCGKDDPGPDPCTPTTWYRNADGDDEGDAASTKESCEQPDGYVANNLDPDDTNANITSDCTMITYYLDNDGDGFGDPDSNTIAQCAGLDAPTDYVTDNTDCNDSDNSIHPGATDLPFDQIDSDCGGEQEALIWDGPDFQFIKAGDADWTLPENQDKLTDKIILTRQNNNVYLYNYQWWQDNFGEDAEHFVDASDLAWEYYGSDVVGSVKDMGNIQASGGVKGGVRWALLDATGVDNPNPAWDNFPLYGTLGDPTHFYSLHNMASIVRMLSLNFQVESVVNDFGIDTDGGFTTNESIFQLVGKKLGVWLVEENIYFTLTFDLWEDDNPSIIYTRSTPNNDEQ